MLIALLFLSVSDDQAIRKGLTKPTGLVELPAGVIEVSSEIVLPRGAHDLEIRGAKEGTVLRATTTFQGRAIFVCTSGVNIRFHNFEIAGSRAALAKPEGLPPDDLAFSRFAKNSGILALNIRDLAIFKVKFREMAGLAVLVSKSSKVRIEDVSVDDSGGQNAKGRNNSTGGILLEEGTTDFEVLRCSLRNIRGNGIWTHSLYTSARNARGLIANNKIDQVGRDAIQVGHATQVRVENNEATRIGFPDKDIDIEHGAIPVALDTAGNTAECVYAGNHFSEINGKCIDLDGFHDGEIRANTCENHAPPASYPHGNYGIVMNNSNPDMESRNVRITGNTLDGTLFGGIYVIGTGNRVTSNRLLNINMAHCPGTAAQFGCFLGIDEPNILTTGIYLGRGAHRPDIARGNIIEDNVIVGFMMGQHCIGVAPGVSLEANHVARNECSDDSTVDAGNRVHQFPIGDVNEALERQELAIAP